MRHASLTWLLFPILAAALAVTSLAGATVPEDFLDALRPDHPRLMLTGPQLEDLKARAESDPDLRRMWGQVRETADGLLAAEPLRHELKGPRLLHVSRACVGRIYPLALAWRWTGDARYAEAALENLKTVCAFPDWNPSHFLDTAEMSHAVAIGYDWLYDFLDEETRAEIRSALIRLGLEEGLEAYNRERPPHWVTSAFNWNQVCHSGLLIGALAIAETDPAYAEAILPVAVENLPNALNSYNPDGVWTEGPAYWHYATRYTAYGLSALESALGSTFGLADTPGLATTAWFPLLTTGPTGLYLNFADSGQNSRRGPMPALFWLARTYDLPGVAALEHQLLEAETAQAVHLMWYTPRAASGVVELPLDRVFESTVPVAVTRSAWNDREALFVGIKGGYNQVAHGHLDLGNFELDALGNRWARDLGSDNYNLPGYWDKKAGGQRWDYYRLNSLSHNVPLIGGAGQDPIGTAAIVRHGADQDGSHVIVDLTKAYTQAERVTRGLRLFGQRRAVIIQDELQLDEALPVTWGMTTDAAITIHGPHSASLEQNGETLRVDVLAPADATLVADSAERPDPEHNNRGVKRLHVEVPAASGALTVAVCLRPVWPDGPEVPLPALEPLDAWGVTAKESPP